jgi:hypothetical protein
MFFRLAIFTGALLLFLVQPLFTRQILPWFGGARGVFTIYLLSSSERWSWPGWAP